MRTIDTAMRWTLVPATVLVWVSTLWAGEAPREELPVDLAAIERLAEVPFAAVRNLIAVEDLHAAIGDGAKGLDLDLSGLGTLLDGTRIDPARVYGTAFFGPYPFEAAETRFAYKRFRGRASVRGGKATLGVGYLLGTRHNSEDWTDQGTVAVRLDLLLEEGGKDRELGRYDLFLGFARTENGYRRLPWLTEGPLVNLVTSDDPSVALIRFDTNEAVPAAVALDDGRRFSTGPGRRHEVRLNRLEPDRAYRYRVEVGPLRTPVRELRTAPQPGVGPVVFAYCGDSREGVGGGMQNYMGVNHATLSRLAATAYAAGARFFLMGGDLINGYTTSPQDFQRFSMRVVNPYGETIDAVENLVGGK